MNELLVISLLLAALALALILAGLRLARQPERTGSFASPANVNRTYTRYAHKRDHFGE